MSEGSSRAEMERRLVERSLQDYAFGRRLMADPRAAVEQEQRGESTAREVGLSAHRAWRGAWRMARTRGRSRAGSIADAGGAE